MTGRVPHRPRSKVGRAVCSACGLPGITASGFRCAEDVIRCAGTAIDGDNKWCFAWYKDAAAVEWIRRGGRSEDNARVLFTKRLREGIRRGRIRCSIRIWTRPHVKVGGRYRMDEGHIVVDSIAPIAITDLTYDLARESGFESVEDLLRTAKHGSGDNAYLIRFHYLPPGAWDTPRRSKATQE